MMGRKLRSRTRSRSYSRSRSRSYDSRGASSPRLYGPEDPQSHPLYKTDVCYQFKHEGKCDKGDMCRFAHGRFDLRIPGKANRYVFPEPRRRSRYRSRSRSRSTSKKRKKHHKRKRSRSPSSNSSSSDSSSSSEDEQPMMPVAEPKMDTQQALLAVQAYEAQVQMACLQGGVALDHPQIQQYLLQLQQIQLAAQSAMLVQHQKDAKIANAVKKKKKKKKKKKRRKSMSPARRGSTSSWSASPPRTDVG